MFLCAIHVFIFLDLTCRPIYKLKKTSPPIHPEFLSLSFHWSHPKRYILLSVMVLVWYSSFMKETWKWGTCWSSLAVQFITTSTNHVSSPSLFFRSEVTLNVLHSFILYWSSTCLNMVLGCVWLLFIVQWFHFQTSYNRMTLVLSYEIDCSQSTIYDNQKAML